MTAVVSPGGTPLNIAATVLNQDLATVDTIAAAGSTQATATAIPRFGQITILQVTRTIGGQGVILPSTAEVGDIVELYVPASGGGSFNIYPQSGGAISNNGTDSPVLDGANGTYFRYLGSGQWGCIRGG